MAEIIPDICHRRTTLGLWRTILSCGEDQLERQNYTFNGKLVFFLFCTFFLRKKHVLFVWRKMSCGKKSKMNATCIRSKFGQLYVGHLY